MLDIDFGTYPYVTSSSTGIGGVLTGLVFLQEPSEMSMVLLKPTPLELVRVHSQQNN